MRAPNQADFDPASIERFYIPAGNANNTNTAFPHDRLGAAASGNTMTSTAAQNFGGGNNQAAAAQDPFS